LGLLEDFGDKEESEKEEEHPEDAVGILRTLARDEVRAHDDALAPHLESHHKVRAEDVEPAEHEKQKPDYGLLIHAAIIPLPRPSNVISYDKRLRAPQSIQVFCKILE